MQYSESMRNISNPNSSFCLHMKPARVIITLQTLYILYKFSHLDLYTDIGNILSKIELSVTEEPITHTVKELVEGRDSGCYSVILNHNIVLALLDQLFID